MINLLNSHMRASERVSMCNVYANSCASMENAMSASVFELDRFRLKNQNMRALNSKVKCFTTCTIQNDRQKVFPVRGSCFLFCFHSLPKYSDRCFCCCRSHCQSRLCLHVHDNEPMFVCVEVSNGKGDLSAHTHQNFAKNSFDSKNNDNLKR